MPATEKPERKKRPFLRWLMRLAIAALVFFALAVAGLWYATLHLTDLARWGMERLFPNATLDLQSLRIVSPQHIEATQIVLKSRRDGATLLTLDKGVAVFQLADLWRRQIGEIRLVNPHITISPGLLTAFTNEGKGGGGFGTGSAWNIRRLVCDYGDVDYTGFGKDLPTVNAKFACDFRNLTNGPGSNQAQQLTLWGLSATAPGFKAPFLSLDLITIGFSLGDLLGKQVVSSITLKGGNFLLNPDTEKFFARASAGPASASPSPPFKIGTLNFNSVNIQIQDPSLRARSNSSDASSISLQLNTRFKDITLSGAASAIGEVEQGIKLTDVEVLSPFDPFVKVFTLHSVLVRFTFSELLQKKLRKVIIDSPTIYVGEDLFWYMENAQKRLASPAGGGTGSGPGWMIDTFNLDHGELVIGSGGNAKYGLPLGFRTQANNVSLDDLAALRLNVSLDIPGQIYSFPSYQLEVSTQEGTLQFSYPPGQSWNNLVGKIYLNHIRWRQYEATTGWITTTFDRNGINGKFGGHACGGYINGGFSFLFDSRSPWIGWVTGKKVDLRQLTAVASPQSFQLTGPMNFGFQFDAFAKKIDRIKGEFHTTAPGHMHIGKLDELLAHIPPAWSNLKKSVTRISLDTLKDFDYTGASGDCWFVLGQGILNMKLQGPAGSRNFKVILHADNSSDGLWKKTTIQP